MVSVCIATHNGEKYIKEQLDSILCQLSPEDEVVISDDGSTDSTLEIIKGYNDPRIKIFTKVHTLKGMKSHYYVTMNFENALKHAKGDYIFLSDQDDVWYPNKVKTCIESLRSYDIVIHNLEFMDMEGNSLGRRRYVDSFEKENILMTGAIHFGCAMAFRAEWLKDILPFPTRLTLHDFWISFIIERLGKPNFLMEPLIRYRFREDSVSHATSNDLIYKIQYRLYIIYFMLCRLIKIQFKKII